MTTKLKKSKNKKDFSVIEHMEYPAQTRKNKRCPKDTPILCGKYTLAKGLCTESKVQCDRRTRRKRSLLNINIGNKGKGFGYLTDDLGRGCYPSKLKLDYEKISTNYDSVPDTFNILTYNIWGLAVRANLRKLFGLRKDFLIKTIKSQKADMMCLQEMSKESYDEMKGFIKSYKFASEVPFPANEAQRNRGVEVYFMSKYTPKRIAIYGLPGVLNYENSMMVVEYANLVIFNIYSQAGSKSSIGQEVSWIHYSRCRYDLLDNIYNMIRRKYSRQSIIITGDFNFHLDGKRKDWPEMEMIEKLKTIGFRDTYRVLNKDAGLTEDTDTNLMRYNQKLIEKHYRFDGIFYLPSIEGWKPKKSSVFGKEIRYLSTEDSQWFYDEMSEVKKQGKDLSALKGVKTLKSGFRLPINPSDHFGVLTSFSK